MLIAQQKFKENIAEYILYMWQVEDMIRACNLDIDVIQERIVNSMVDEEAIRKEIRVWYADLISKMKLEGKEKNGHLRDLDDLFIEINYLHGTLIGLLGDEKSMGNLIEKRVMQGSPRDCARLREIAGGASLGVSWGCLGGALGCPGSPNDPQGPK